MQVVQNAFGHPAKCLEGMLVASHQRLHFHVGDELDVAGAAESQGCAEGMQGVGALPELHPVHLQLLAGFGLETHHRVGRRLRFERAHEGTQLT